jgi:hypothetical protein
LLGWLDHGMASLRKQRHRGISASCAGRLQSDDAIIRTRVDIRLVVIHVADILIRDVSDETLAELDAAAGRAGISRVEYVRRTLAAEAERAARGASSPLTRDDWTRLHELTADLGDDDIMRGAWS